MKKEYALIKTLTKIPKSVFFFCFLINLSVGSVFAAEAYGTVGYADYADE